MTVSSPAPGAGTSSAARVTQEEDISKGRRRRAGVLHCSSTLSIRPSCAAIPLHTAALPPLPSASPSPLLKRWHLSSLIDADAVDADTLADAAAASSSCLSATIAALSASVSRSRRRRSSTCSCARTATATFSLSVSSSSPSSSRNLPRNASTPPAPAPAAAAVAGGACLSPWRRRHSARAATRCRCRALSPARRCLNLRPWCCGFRYCGGGNGGALHNFESNNTPAETLLEVDEADAVESCSS